MYLILNYQEQMKRIDDLNKDQRIGPDPDTFEGQ